jgi:hypothetical protein
MKGKLMGNQNTMSDLKEMEEQSVSEEKSQVSLDDVEEEESEEGKEEKIKKTLTKNEESKAMMQEAEELINQADKEVKEIQSVVAQNVAVFEKEKLTLSNTTITHSMSLLEKVGYDYNQELPDEPFEISLGTTTTEDVRVSSLSSGGFTGFILAIISMVATLVGWIYVAAQKTGTALDPQKILETPPTLEELTPLFSWIGGGMTGGEGNAQFGMATVGLSALFVGYMVYKLRVMLKESKNFKVAKNTYERSHTYVEQQKESKSEMERIDAHINKVTPLLENYRVLLDEENAKLQRILHIEGQLEDSSEYHLTSQQIMRDTDRLMDRVEKLIMTPITKEGRLNEASVNALVEAEALYESYIAKLYA